MESLEFIVKDNLSNFLKTQTFSHRLDDSLNKVEMQVTFGYLRVGLWMLILGDTIHFFLTATFEKNKCSQDTKTLIAIQLFQKIFVSIATLHTHTHKNTQKTQKP